MITNIFKSIGITAAILIILSIAGFWGWLKWLDYNRPEIDRSCLTSDRILVKMGEHVFAVPRRNNLYLEGKSIPKTPGSQMVCYKPGDPPIEVTRFSFLPDDLPGYRSDVRKEGSFFAIQIIVSSPNQQTPNDMFTEVKKQLEEKKISLDQLPLKNNFYLLDDAYYIARDNDFIMRNGNPVVFNCGRAGLKLRCNTKFPWKDNININVRQISTVFVPLIEWKNFYHKIDSYMDAINVAK